MKRCACFLMLVALFTLNGCGVNYVAAQRDFGLKEKEPIVYGVVAKKCIVNDTSNYFIDFIVASTFVDYINKNGGKAVLLNNKKLLTVDKAASTYSTMRTNWAQTRPINSETKFDPVASDLEKAGANALIVIGVDAYAPSFGRVMQSMAADAAINSIAYGNIASTMFIPVTPSSFFSVLVVNKDGSYPVSP